MDGSAAAPSTASADAVGPTRRLLSWVRAGARRLAQIVARIGDALHRQTTRPAISTAADEPRTASGASTEQPRWGVVAIGLAVAGGLLAFRLSPATALYWYAFPLFGIGVAYVIQFRSELTGRWWAVLGASAVLSAVALAQDWAFSGHVLFNVLLLGHAAQSRTRQTWIRLLLASLAELFVLKVAFQRPMDAVGGVISVGVAIVALALAGPRRERNPSPDVVPAPQGSSSAARVP